MLEELTKNAAKIIRLVWMEFHYHTRRQEIDILWSLNCNVCLTFENEKRRKKETILKS